MVPLSLSSGTSPIATEEDTIREIRAQRIRDGTLSDEECVIELQERRAVFLDDPEWLPECRRYGEDVFKKAIERDVDVALGTGQRVIGVLHLVLVQVGGLWLDNKRLKAEITGIGIDEVDIVITSSDVEREDEDETKNDEVSEEDHEGVLGATGEEDAHTARLDAALAARRKRRQLTHGASRIDDSSISRRSQSHIADAEDEFDATHIPSPLPFSPKTPLDGSNTGNATRRRSRRGFKVTPSKRNLAHNPSLIPQPSMSLEKPLLSPDLDNVSKQPVPTTESQIAKTRMLPLDTPAALFVGGPGNKQGHNRRSVLRAQRPKPPVAAPEPEPPRKKRKMVVLKVGKQVPRRTSTRQRKPMRPRFDTPDSTKNGSINKIGDVARLAPSSEPTPNPPPKSTIKPHSSKLKSPPKRPAPLDFPLLPLMPPRDLPPFLKGAEITLDNIVSDHLDDPEVSLLELIEEVEENQPAVEDWERKTIVKGGEWVCGVLRDCVEKSGGEGVEGDEGVGGLVRKLGMWVEGGWRG